MLVRRERSGDERAIRRVHAAAFRRATAERDSPAEVSLVDNLRASRDWLAKLSLVAMDGGEVIGHVLCTRARLAQAPIGVLPEHQGTGVGHALIDHRAVVAPLRS